MRIMQQALGRLFKPQAGRKPADPHYAKFRAYCKGKGLTYKVARDGYIEFSDGAVFGHYGDWSETQARHEAGEGK